MSLSPSQKVLLQMFMIKGSMDSSSVKTNFTKCRVRYKEDPDINHLKEFLKQMNIQLRELHFEIKKGVDEDRGSSCYVLINTVDNDYLMNTGVFTEREMDYFKVLMRHIVMSDDGRVSVVDALNYVDSLENKMLKKEAVPVIEKWVKLNWLKQAGSAQHLTMHIRAVLELEHYIRDVYSEFVKDCEFCHRLCIRGMMCSDCEVKIHTHCGKTYMVKQNGEGKCPNKNCGEAWPELAQLGATTNGPSTSKKSRLVASESESVSTSSCLS